MSGNKDVSKFEASLNGSLLKEISFKLQKLFKYEWLTIELKGSSKSTLCKSPMNELCP